MNKIIEEFITKYILDNIGYSLINEYYNSKNNVNVVLLNEKLYVRYNLISEIATVFNIPVSRSFMLIKKTLKTVFNIDVYEFFDSEFLNSNLRDLRRYTNEFFEYINFDDINETLNTLKNKDDFELINEFKLFFYKAKMYFVQKGNMNKATLCAKINLELKQFLVKKEFLNPEIVSKFS